MFGPNSILELPFTLFRRQAISMTLNDYYQKKRTQQPQRMEIQTPVDSLMPWVEKYRPKQLSDIVYQDNIVSSLRAIRDSGNLPHLLFYGPAGTGKTSAILALSKELFGPVFYKQRILQLNASDERGIGVIRDKVKKFALHNSVKPVDKNYKCPKYKIIILDEADLLTKDAQSALRRIIEDNSQRTRFCLICNYITKLIEPLTSRFIKYRFKSIPMDIQIDQLRMICKNENIGLNTTQIESIIQKGDLRQAINYIQGFKSVDKINSHILPISEIHCRQILKLVKECRNIEQVMELTKNVEAEGYSYIQLLKGLFRAVLKANIDTYEKSVIIQHISKCQEYLLVGCKDVTILFILSTIYTLLQHQN